MFKQIIILSLSIALISCQSNQSKNQEPVKTEVKTQNLDASKPGNYETFDSQEQADKANELANQNEIEVPDRVNFDLGSSNINEASAKILDIQVEWLKSDNSINITLEGHCDERGSREYNIALGEKRAVAVKKYLVKKGIAGNRLKTVSFGKEKPAFFGNTEEVHAKNRRVVVVIK